jgi:formate hydrogenlyase subunit 4
MTDVQYTFLHGLCLVLLPFITIGFIRKTKARLQNRTGASIIQPLLNVIKLLQKSETISEEASGAFRGGAIMVAATTIAIALFVPWLPFGPIVPGVDIFLVIYMFAMARFFMMISALDPGSAFSAFGASREATLSMLTEPCIILAMTALGIATQSANLNKIFALGGTAQLAEIPVWLLAGAALFIASLVELSRMPVDDPTTHLELTMVHEAMIIENSGPNLALIEISYALRMVVLYGLASQCFLHALTMLFRVSYAWSCAVGVLLIFVLAAITAAIESFGVKLAWRKNPEFIAYSLTLSLLACMAAVVKGVI